MGLPAFRIPFPTLDCFFAFLFLVKCYFFMSLFSNSESCKGSAWFRLRSMDIILFQYYSTSLILKVPNHLLTFKYKFKGILWSLWSFYNSKLAYSQNGWKLEIMTCIKNFVYILIRLKTVLFRFQMVVLSETLIHSKSEWWI